MRGTLIYLMGPSGVGKDSLIAYARARLPRGQAVIFAHRYITRPTQAGHENYVSLSEAEFDLRRRHDLFLFEWAAHGYSYGAGIEIGLWLERGLTVLVNGSRAYLPAARKRLSELMPAYVHAPRDVLRRRLIERGRETEAEVDLRLERMSDYAAPPGCFLIDNAESLEHAGQQLLGLLHRLSGSTQPEDGAAPRRERIG